MELRELTTETLAEIYYKYMTTDFPQDELKPLKRMVYMMEAGLSCAYGIYEQESLRGYAVFIVPEGFRYGLLDYLAVLEEYRGTGIGHAFFEMVGSTLVAKYPELIGFFVETEAAAHAADVRDRRVREKRISFYVKNGCTMTTLGSKLFGVVYSILVYDFGENEDEPASIEDLNNVYLVMFSKAHYEDEVSLWDRADRGDIS